MKPDTCFFCSEKFDKHTKNELLDCAIKIVKGVSET